MNPSRIHISSAGNNPTTRTGETSNVTENRTMIKRIPATIHGQKVDVIQEDYIGGKQARIDFKVVKRGQPTHSKEVYRGGRLKGEEYISNNIFTLTVYSLRKSESNAISLGV